MDSVLGLCPNTYDSNSFSCSFGKRIQSQMVVHFFLSATQQIHHVKNWISSRNSHSKPPKAHFQIIHDNFLLSMSSFPSNKDFKKHIKILKQKASETLTLFFYFGSNDDTASFAFLGDVNKNMCYGMPYTSLE